MTKHIIILIFALICISHVSSQKTFDDSQFSDSNLKISRFLTQRIQKTSEVENQIIIKQGIDDAINKKQWTNALKLINQYQSDFQDGVFLEEILSKRKEVERKYRQRGTNLAVFTYDYETGSFGLYSHALDIKDINAYIGLRINPELFKLIESREKVTNENMTQNGEYILTGQTKLSNAAISGGITFKVTYPLWFHLGGGLGYEALLLEADDTILEETVFLTNQDASSIYFFPEVGFTFQILRAIGINYTAYYHEQIFHQIGLGIQF